MRQHQANRAGWNEGAEWYAEHQQEGIEFLRSGGKNFCPPELPYLEGLGEWCRRAIHLQCAGGRDTLSLWNLGAHEVVGVDISDRMIELARGKSDALKAPAMWFRCDVLETHAELDGTADLVYTGRGAINWIMDIEAWARVPARLLKPGGKLYVFEGHPISSIWQLEAKEFLLDPDWGDYFNRTPHAEQGWPDTYIGALSKPKEQHATKHEVLWGIGDVINALLAAGLVMERFEEHADPYWDMFPNMAPGLMRRIPQTFSLLMRKQ
ncbi:MAG: class I SAM-dependent methyltransferase [Fimbriimonadaceae bacterium]